MPSLQSYARIGVLHGQIFHHVVDNGDDDALLSSLDSIAHDHFFTAIAIGHIADPTLRAASKSILTTSGLYVMYTSGAVIISQSLNISSSDESLRDHSVRVLDRCLHEAAEYGATQFNVISGSYDHSVNEDDQLAQLTDSLSRLCESAQQLDNITVVLDVPDRDYDRKSLVGATDLAVKLSENISNNYANFGITLDISHMPLLGENTADMVHLASDQLVNVHIGNCYLADPSSTAYGDAHPRFGIDDSLIGTRETSALLRGLLDIGYLAPQSVNPLQLNLRPQPGESPLNVLANGKRHLRAAWEAAIA